MTDIFISQKAEWKRPFTTKLYLHPPEADEIVTLWPDGKVLLGRVAEGCDESEDARTAGIKMLVGADLDELDFTKAEFVMDEEGIPIHQINFDNGDYDITIQAFCDIKQRPAVYAKITFINKSTWTITDDFALLLRSGNQRILMGMEQAGYAHFHPNVHNWGFLESRWNYSDGKAMDDEYSISFDGIQKFCPIWSKNVGQWYQRKTLRMKVSLKPGEERSFHLCFKRGETGHFDYSHEREKTTKYWKRQIDKIEYIPYSSSRTLTSLFKNLVVQNLQMFSYLPERDGILTRQGGMQRAMWPFEALYLINCLDMVGDFYELTEKSIDFLLQHSLITEGKDKGFLKPIDGIMSVWAVDTAAFIGILAGHMVRGGVSALGKYREIALSSLDYIERLRKSSPDGLFPAMIATDSNDVKRSYLKTDMGNLRIYQLLIDAFRQLDDSAAEIVQHAYDEYFVCIQHVLDAELARVDVADSDEILLPMYIGGEPIDPPQNDFFIHDIINVLGLGFVDSKSEIARKLMNYYHNRGLIQNGLYGLMQHGLLPGNPWDPWAGHTWYTSFADYFWFQYYLKNKEKEKAAEILRAQLKYSMTREFYMCERYADNDPYFVPWLPNASANGRTLMMLLEAEKQGVEL